MKFADLPVSEIASQLRGEGLCLRTGPIACRIQTAFSELAAPLRFLYAQHNVELPGAWADYHMRLRRSIDPRHWFLPRIVLAIDGAVSPLVFPRNAIVAMLEWGLNQCIYKYAHQYLILHAAVLERGGKALLLCAPPGSGKSTLCAALAFRGWRLLSDELALVRPRDGYVDGLARPICLKNRSVSVIRDFAPEAQFGPTVPGTIKGVVSHVRPTLESVMRVDEPARPAWVVFPKYEPGAATDWQPLSPGPGFLRLIDNSFNYSILGVEGFQTLANLVDGSQCFEFTYSNLDDAVRCFEALEPSASLVAAEMAG
jgi:HprK-related kinase A